MVFPPAGPLLLGRNDILLYSSVEACILYRNVYVYHFLPCHYLYYCKAAFIRWLRFRLAVHGMYRYLYRRYPASVHRNLRFLPFPHLYGGQKTAYLYLQGKQFKPR